jgi:hypothetical protein
MFANYQLSVSVIPADPNTLPAPCGRNPAPTRGAIETCPDGERDSSESESISEEETVAEAEPRSKAGTSDEAAAKTCTPESAADKSTPEAAAGKAPTEATATKTTSAETTATKTTSLTRVGSDHGTHERDGSQRNHHLTQHGTFLPARASASVFCSTNVPSKNAIEKEIITRSQHADGVDVPDFFVTIAASARWGTDRLRTRDHSCSLKEKAGNGPASENFVMGRRSHPISHLDPPQLRRRPASRRGPRPQQHPSDEAAMMAPRAARPATRRASGAVSFQS